MAWISSLFVVLLLGCAVSAEHLGPPAPDASDDIETTWCIPTPPPQPAPGTGDPAPGYPDEFAVCLHEEERTKLVLYLSSLRAYSEELYATYGCE